MKIAICGPVSLQLLEDLIRLNPGEELPDGYQYPLAAYLARILHARGHDVALVTSSVQTKETEIWRGERITIYHTPRRRYFKFTLDAYARERRSMLKSLEDFQPDIVHAQWTYEFAHLALDSGFPVLVTARDAPWTIFRHTRTPYRLYRALYAHYVIPKVKKLSAISNNVADRIRKEYRYVEPIKLIPNGLSRGLFASKIPQQADTEAPSFISVTGWDSRKNVKTLLRAFAEVHREIPASKLILIGRGIGPNESGAVWARRQNLASSVEFRGSLSHAEILNSLRYEGNIFVHSTLEESFCMTVLEAMAQGLPAVVLPDSGAVPWVVGDGAAGMIASSQASKSLSQAMLALAKDLELREHLGKTGYDRALSMFELETIADCYLKEYHDTIQHYAAKI